MRRLYNYQTIRYCPNIDSDEFFNVGIHLANDEKNVLHFINDTHLSKLMSFPSVDKNSIVKFIDILNKEVNLSHWYGNYLKFSEKKYFRSSQNFEEVLEILYEDYIGYKFHIKEKIDTIEIIKQDTKELVVKEFSKYLEVNENTIFDFDIVDKKTSKHHYSDVGSLSNKEHINAIIWRVEDFLLSNAKTNASFELLNITNAHNQVANNILHKSSIIDIDYFDEDSRFRYLKSVAGV